MSRASRSSSSAISSRYLSASWRERFCAAGDILSLNVLKFLGIALLLSCLQYSSTGIFLQENIASAICGADTPVRRFCFVFVRKRSKSTATAADRSVRPTFYFWRAKARDSLRALPPDLYAPGSGGCTRVCLRSFRPTVRHGRRILLARPGRSFPITYLHCGLRCL